MQNGRTIQRQVGLLVVLLALLLSTIPTLAQTTHQGKLSRLDQTQTSSSDFKHGSPLTSSTIISGTWDTAFGNSLATDGTITKLHLDANNRLYVAGNFNYLNGQLFNGLASWDGTTWQGYGLQANDVDTINALDSYQNQLVVAGRFRQLAGQVMNGLVRWDGSQFQAFGTGISGINDSYRSNAVSQVYDLEVLGDTLYLGGNFDSFNGVAAHGTAYWQPNSFGEFGNFNGVINHLDAIPNAVFAQGSVSRVNQTSIQGYGLWNGTAWQNPSLPNAIGVGDQIGRIGTTLYAWPNINNQSIVYRWNAGQWQSIGMSIEGKVLGVVESNGLYAYTSEHLWRLTNNQWQKITPYLGIGTIKTVVGNANGLYFAGDFLINDNQFQLIYWNGVDSVPLAYTKVHSPIYDLTGVQGAPIINHDSPNTIKFWTGWHWENRRFLDASAQLLTTSNDHAYMVSEFPFFGSHASSTIAEFDRDGNLSSTLALTGSPMTWTLSGTHLLASSDFTRIDSQPITSVVAIDQLAWHELGLKPTPGKIYFANNRIYSIMIVQNHDWWEVNIDSWNGTNWQDFTALHIQSNGSLPQFVAWQNQLYFTNGNAVHRLEGTTSRMMFEFDAAPLQLANINDRYLYIAGAFSKVGDQALGSVVRWNGIFWQAPLQTPNGAVEQLAVSEKYLYLSGKFTHIGASPSLGVASLQLAAEPEPLPYHAFIPQVIK